MIQLLFQNKVRSLFAENASERVFLDLQIRHNAEVRQELMELPATEEVTILDDAGRIIEVTQRDIIFN